MVTDADCGRGEGEGAIPVVLSPVPRNLWTKDGLAGRASRDYGLWADQVAQAEEVAFVDLNELITRRDEAIGREAVGRDLFSAADPTHTTHAGVKLNAECVAEGLHAAGVPGVADALVVKPWSAPRVGCILPNSPFLV